MGKYIDAEKLKTEIESLKTCSKKSLLALIDSLPSEKVVSAMECVEHGFSKYYEGYDEGMRRAKEEDY